MTTEDLYLEGEERFGPVTTYLFGLGTFFMNKYYDIIVEDLKSKEFDLLLDVGCGNGALLSRLASNFPDSRFYGLDPSPHMLQRARKKLIKEGLISRVELGNGSNRVIPFEHKFDALISSFSYHHWKDRDSSLSRLMSHLSEKGFASIYEYDNSSRRLNTSHGVKESEWTGIDIDGMKKTITHKDGLIILTLTK
ncbi:MAG: class I SAM-dependent methyltransferase [Thermoplasmatales archaeon]|nr:class I SAM-dependent methyltransferase [Candidatus Thermoplasmatota archaeon]MCL6002219.1 class I SAM-dependent methyltransferase [Candidatus Thermoplasmatota archaeon]MDA8055474.1 class I SAM-dependent methyltransferase [Thermoplasmatales archaeon]